MTSPAVRALADVLRSWFDPVDYEWQIDYLRSRHLLAWARLVVSGGGALIACTAVLSLLGPTTQFRAHGQVVMAALGIAALLWAVRWAAFPWPGRIESLAMVGAADIGVAIAGFTHADLVLGVATANLFAVIGCYVLVFHDARTMLLHIAFTTTTIVAMVVVCGMETNPQIMALAAAKALIAITLNAFLLPMVQITYRMLRNSADESTIDTLTGLHNRRGLDHALLLAAQQTTDTPWVVLFVDVDELKSINDTFGHAKGDDVLRIVAQLLARAVDDHGMACRSGGDEFVLALRTPTSAHTWPDVDAAIVAERIRRGVEQETGGVATVSIGISYAPTVVGVTSAIEFADRAMYAVKQSGGNGSVADQGLEDQGSSL